MKVDLSEELGGLNEIEFDSPYDRRDYIRQKILEGLKQVVDQSLAWVSQNVNGAGGTETWQHESEYYEAMLIAGYAERAANRSLASWNRVLFLREYQQKCQQGVE